MEWRIEKEETLDSEVNKQVELMPIITFILGTIATGFLEEIGNQIWDSVSEIFSDARAPLPGFRFKFNYQQTEIEAKVKTENLAVLKEALQNLKQVKSKLNPEKKQLKFIWDSTTGWQLAD